MSLCALPGWFHQPHSFKYHRSRQLHCQLLQCGLISSALVFLTSSLTSPVVVLLSLLFLLHFIPCLMSLLPSSPDRKSGAVLERFVPSSLPALACCIRGELLLHVSLLEVHGSSTTLCIRSPQCSCAAGDGRGHRKLGLPALILGRSGLSNTCFKGTNQRLMILWYSLPSRWRFWVMVVSFTQEQLSLRHMTNTSK